MHSFTSGFKGISNDSANIIPKKNTPMAKSCRVSVNNSALLNDMGSLDRNSKMNCKIKPVNNNKSICMVDSLDKSPSSFHKSNCIKEKIEKG